MYGCYQVKAGPKASDTTEVEESDEAFFARVVRVCCFIHRLILARFQASMLLIYAFVRRKQKSKLSLRKACLNGENNISPSSKKVMIHF